MTSPLATAAADYLSKGLAVIALTGKMPNTAIHKRGLDQPLTGAVVTAEDAALVRSVFDHPETTGVGIVIKWPYVVVDIDGEDGAVQWQALVGDATFQTWTAKTGRGLHIWFISLQETGTIKLGPKLDLKAPGGYVAAPPSRHPDGGTYEWLRAPEFLYLPTPAPEALEDRITAHIQSASKWKAGNDKKKPIRGPRYQPGDTVFHAQYGYGAVIEGMKSAAEGNRNNYLHWAAATLAEEGGIDEDFDELAEAALAAGLEADEVRATLRSARRLHG